VGVCINFKFLSTMTFTQIEELSALLSEFTRISPFELGSDEDRTLWAALEIINEHLEK